MRDDEAEIWRKSEFEELEERRREQLIKVVLHNIERLNFLECVGR